MSSTPIKGQIKGPIKGWCPGALRPMESGDGLVLRIAHDVVPPHVDYRLTPLGVEAAEKVRLLADWVETSLPQIAAGWADRAA